VTITGSGFTASAANTIVKFGVDQLTGSAITVVDQKTIKFKAPKVTTATPISVTVKTPVGESLPQKYTYFAKSNTEFYLKVVPAQITFSSKDGKVESLTLFQNGQTIPGKRIQ